MHTFADRQAQQPRFAALSTSCPTSRGAVLRIRDVYPGSWFYPSQVPDPTTAPKEEGEKIFCPAIFSHNYHKIANNCIFEQIKKIFLAKTLRIKVLFIQKFVFTISKICVWDPGTGKNLFRIPNPGSKRHRIPDPDPQHWIIDWFTHCHQ
jgi:hypothetical protein